ncbi:tetratricopeptide repeat protein [Chitinimonas sp. BJYL2]|uniref:YfgM family protein n=1 Tax=Chitinimonas sp. BJYL2 TaxID=2976696 RepID=UPI0022B57358|nr:tetratricopeptide repeat protein [Chitinimonas sp. BJYL2]
MAAFDLQEQEQIAELKAWWAKWGKLLVTALVAALLGYFGNMGWKHWQKSTGESAALALNEVEKAFESKDLAKTRAAADAMVSTVPDHALTSRAMLLVAKLAFDSEKLDDAKSALEWVVSHGKESAIVDIARLRLAAVLMDQKQYDAALKTLDQPKSDSFAPQFAESRGDALALKGDAAAAKQAYQAALTALEADSPAKNVVETKLSALGV